MSFDLMRRHRRKVEVPLAIFVVITFVLFFGISGIDKVVGEWRQGGGDLSDTDAKLLADSRDLVVAGMMPDPRGEVRGKDRDEQARQERQAYIETARFYHHTPAKLAEELGIQVSNEDLSKELAKRLKDAPWNLEPMKAGETDEQYQQRYLKALRNRGLSEVRYEKLLREEMAAERLQKLLEMTGTASEAEMYGYYAEAKQKVRVQYFQRRAADFIKDVEEATKKEAAEAAAPAKAPEKVAGKEGAEAAPAKVEPKAEPKGVSDADVRKLFDANAGALRARNPREDRAWDERLVNGYPEYFSEERAQVEYLVALRDRFAKGVTVKPEEIDKYYKDNPAKFQEEAKPEDKAKDAKDAKDGKDGKAGEEPKTKLRLLDIKLREEIRKTLVENQAAAAAEEALKAAVKEYNEADPENRPKLGALVAKHKLETPGMAGPAEREDIEELQYLKDASWLVEQAFSDSSRREAGGKFFTPERTKANEKDQEQTAWVALRLAKFEPHKLVSFDQAKATIRERLVLDKALKLAKEAIEADRKLLVERKLDPKLVRTSVLLGPEDETTEQAVSLALGEASKPYAYKDLLGSEADAEKARQKQKEKEKDAGKKSREKPAIADSYAKGYRVVILVERITPTVEEFQKDQAFRERWSPDMPRISGLPEGYRQYFMQQMMRNSPGLQWRSFYREAWVRERYKQSMPAPQ